MKIQKNCFVTLCYTIDPATASDFSYPRGPYRMNALIGYHRLPPALEEAIMGLEAGDRRQVLVAPQDLFGADRDEQPVPVAAEDVIGSGRPLEIGSIHHWMDSERRLRPFRVVAVQGDTVLADFRHPLAGQALRFHVSIDEVRWATLEEVKEALSNLRQ